MNPVFALVLLAMLQGWAVRVLNEDELVIENNTDMSIICYVYYMDGDFKKMGVRAHSDSRPFSRYGLDTVECF